MLDATAVISQGGTTGLLTALCVAVAAMGTALGWLAVKLYSSQEDHAKALLASQTKQSEDLMRIHQQAAADLAKVQEARIVEMAAITKAAETLSSAIDLVTRPRSGKS